MNAERLDGKWGRIYLGPQIYRCPSCGVEYEHDGAYQHQVFECAARLASVPNTREA